MLSIIIWFSQQIELYNDSRIINQRDCVTKEMLIEKQTRERVDRGCTAMKLKYNYETLVVADTIPLLNADVIPHLKTYTL